MSTSAIIGYTYGDSYRGVWQAHDGGPYGTGRYLWDLKHGNSTDWGTLGSAVDPAQLDRENYPIIRPGGYTPRELEYLLLDAHPGGWNHVDPGAPFQHIARTGCDLYARGSGYGTCVAAHARPECYCHGYLGSVNAGTPDVIGVFDACGGDCESPGRVRGTGLCSPLHSEWVYILSDAGITILAHTTPPDHAGAPLEDYGGIREDGTRWTHYRTAYRHVRVAGVPWDAEMGPEDWENLAELHYLAGIPFEWETCRCGTCRHYQELLARPNYVTTRALTRGETTLTFPGGVELYAARR